MSDVPRVRYVKESVELPPEILEVDDMIREMVMHQYLMNMHHKSHEMIWGTPCGPALCMADPTKLGYGGWIGW